MPETHHIYRWMRVREVIGFCKSCFRPWNDQTCREMLELFGLDPEKKVKHLSKGMLVKLALLLAVSHEPELLLLDEPLSGLDPIAREEFLDGVLRTICDRGQTVLISSHMLDDVRRLADTVGILYEGRLVVQGNLDELLTTTKRICATLRDGCRPERPPEGTIWQRVQGREWTSRSAISRRKRFSKSGARRRRARRRGRPGAGRTVQGLHSRTKGSTMKWLLWKDYRQNRLIVIMALFIVVVPHLIAVIVTCYAKYYYHNYNSSADFTKTLFISAIYSLFLSSIVFAFMGGNAIACERSDRSAEFLAYLPISRGKILTSKFLVALLIGAFIWIINLSIMGISWLSFPESFQQPNTPPFGVITGGFLIAGLTFFCIAWLFSSFMQSPAISAGSGLFTPLVLAYAFGFIVQFFVVVENISIFWPMGLAIALSLASFVGGTWYYLLRVEP